MSYVLFVLGFTIAILIYNIYAIYRLIEYNEDKVIEAIAIDIVAIIVVATGIIIFITKGGLAL